MGIRLRGSVGWRGTYVAAFATIIILATADLRQVQAACAFGACFEQKFNGTSNNSDYGGGYYPVPIPQPRQLSPEEREAQEYDELLDSAEMLIGMEKFDTALAEVDEALSIRPGDPVALSIRERIFALKSPPPYTPSYDSTASYAPPYMPSPGADTSLPTSVVDARGLTVDLRLPIPEMMEYSPALGEWRKGMDAVRQRDWQLATAWFKQGLFKDPANDALIRAAELAEWTIKFRDQEQSAHGAMTIIDRAFDARDNGDRYTYENALAQIRNHPNYGDPQAQRWRDLVFQRLEERSLAGGPKPYAQMTPEERLSLSIERLMGEALAEDFHRMGTSALLDSRPADARTAFRASAVVAPHIPHYRRYADALDNAW